MVGGCIHGAHLLSFIEIRANGFNLPHFWQNTAVMVAETLLSPFQGTKQYECRGLWLQHMSKVTDGWWVHSRCTPAKFYRN